MNGRTLIPKVVVALAFLVSVNASAWAQFCAPGTNCKLSGGTPPVPFPVGGTNTGPAPGGMFNAMSSGLMTYTQTDLTVQAPMPITISRTYRSRDLNSGGTFNARSFGLGTMLNYDIYLYSSTEVTSGTYTEASIVLPDGGSINCQCASGANCSSYTTMELVCNSQPTGIWFGSTIAWDSSTLTFNVTRKDKTVYSFGKDAPLVSITDPNQNEITISRGTTPPSGTGCTNPGTYIASYAAGVATGRWVFLCKDASNFPAGVTKAIDNSGRYVTYTYSNGTTDQLSEVYFPSYSTTAEYFFEYGTGAELGDLKTVGGFDMALGIAYDSSHRLYELSYDDINLTNPFTYTYTLNSSGDIETVTATMPKGSREPAKQSQRTLTFDDNGYLIQDERGIASGSTPETTTYTRDSANELITSILDPLNRTTTFTYDGNNSDITLGNLTSVIEAYGTNEAAETQYAYDPNFSEVDEVIDPSNQPNGTSWQFPINPANGNVTELIDPMNRTWQFGYNNAGQITSITDPSPFNYLTQFGYNATTGDLISIEDPLGNTTNFVTDSLGRVTSQTTPLNETTSFVYDALDHVTSQTDPDGNATAFTYDPTSARLTKLKNALGNAWTWSYTAPSGSGYMWNWEECGPGGGCYTAQYDWATSLPLVYTDVRTVSDNYSYDDFDRLQELQYNVNATSGYPQTTINYTYDAGDRISEMVDTGGGNHSSSGNTQDIYYDLLDNVTEFKSPEGTVNYGYQGSGYYWSLRQSMQLVGQSQVNYTYNPAEQLTEVQQGGLSASIGYDQAARRLSLTLPNDVAVNYTYDNDSRITQLAYAANSNSLGALTYNYDSDSRAVGKGGSLAAVNLPAALSANAYNIGNRITKWNGVTAGGYDANNNLTTDPSNGDTYTWNERNQLRTLNGATRSFYYDAAGRRESYYDVGTSISYLWDGIIGIQVDNPSLVQNMLTSLDGEVLAVTTSAGTMVPIHDTLGSTIGLVNSSGTIPTTFTYTPFGQVTTVGTASTFPYLFAGMEYDWDTGLYHTPARYYSPTLQRWLSEDPLRYGGGDVNLFAYAGNDPVDNADPTGLQYCVYGIGTDAGALSSLTAAMNGDLPLGLAAAVADVTTAAPSAAVSTSASGVSAQGSGGFGIPGSLGIPSNGIVLAQLEEEEGPAKFDPGNDEGGGAGGGDIPAGGTGGGGADVPQEPSIPNESAKRPPSPIEGLPRAGSALKVDDGDNPFHGFPGIIDNFSGDSSVTELRHGVILYQVEGSLNGVPGRFEWIVDDGAVTHRYFVKGGKLNGIPIKP